MTRTTVSIVGSLSFPLLADRWGRKTALLIYFSECLLSVHSTFSLVQNFTTALITPSVMGFFVGRICAGFTVYFPELFPTSIRATAHGFCYNSARLPSALAPFTTGLLVSTYGFFAPAITAVGLVYLPGVFIMVLFARVTKGQPLPD